MLVVFCVVRRGRPRGGAACWCREWYTPHEAQRVALGGGAAQHYRHYFNVESFTDSNREQQPRRA
ncbi:hypothetical protein E2C01_008248 [Portunus trituberculatus]|uniref:Uncharacterized protein n=1 Tax=Portunus trituberculatus TaxID=210409 RepID=A0A5B7D495_PORTR|nr:hypothetical protein [Portunus trituberculatus]